MTNSQPNTPFIRPGQSHETEVSSVTDNTQKSYERHIQAIENEIESESKTSTGKNRKRPKKAIIATACILLVAIAVPTVMYFLQVGPFTPKLSEKEQEYVGTWKASFTKDNGKTVDIQQSDIKVSITLNDDRSYTSNTKGIEDSGKWTADTNKITLVNKDKKEHSYPIENGRIVLGSVNNIAYYLDPPSWDGKSEYIGRWKVIKCSSYIGEPNMFLDLRGTGGFDIIENDENVYLSGFWEELSDGSIEITSVTTSEDGDAQQHTYIATKEDNLLILKTDSSTYTIDLENR